MPESAQDPSYRQKSLPSDSTPDLTNEQRLVVWLPSQMLDQIRDRIALGEPLVVGCHRVTKPGEVELAVSWIASPK